MVRAAVNTEFLLYAMPNRDYLHWPHSKWQPVGYHSYFKEGVVLEKVY